MERGVKCKETGIAEIEEGFWHVQASNFQLREKTALYECVAVDVVEASLS